MNDVKTYVIKFTNGDILSITGSFDNSEMIASGDEIAIFVDPKINREYKIPLCNVLYIYYESSWGNFSNLSYGNMWGIYNEYCKTF